MRPDLELPVRRAPPASCTASAPGGSRNNPTSFFILPPAVLGLRLRPLRPFAWAGFTPRGERMGCAARVKRTGDPLAFVTAVESIFMTISLRLDGATIAFYSPKFRLVEHTDDVNPRRYRRKPVCRTGLPAMASMLASARRRRPAAPGPAACRAIPWPPAPAPPETD